MAFPHWPDRLGPHCEFPPSDRELEPPPDYDPPVADPVQSHYESKPLTVWQVGIRILLLLTALIAAVVYWKL